MVADDAIRFWFASANIDGQIGLGEPIDPKQRSVRDAMESARSSAAQSERTVDQLERQIASLETQPSSAQAIAQRAELRSQILPIACRRMPGMPAFARTSLIWTQTT